MSDIFARLVTGNGQHVSSFAGQALSAPPRLHLVVLTCMDTRIDPLAMAGLAPGDAQILRNAGGRVTDDVERSLVVASRVLGVRAVAVVHHSDCGMHQLDEGDVIAQLPGDAELQLLAFDDAEEALRADVERLRTSTLLPPLDVAGFVYDVTTGELVEHVPAGEDAAAASAEPTRRG